MQCTVCEVRRFVTPVIGCYRQLTACWLVRHSMAGMMMSAARVSTTPGNPGNLLEFVWSSWKFLCKMSMIDCIGSQS